MLLVTGIVLQLTIFIHNIDEIIITHLRTYIIVGLVDVLFCFDTQIALFTGRWLEEIMTDAEEGSNIVCYIIKII